MILKKEIIRRVLGPEDAIFVLDDGRPLTAEVYRKVWRQARAAVLQARELDSRSVGMYRLSVTRASRRG
ncbi:hypothetical protein [Streptomyces sp. CAU 1734]|uniref:hypothetical protein n=1 Tax=Streptomyces sp. CAU 1734 TaxID=3140360 RepID=UPI0032603EE6